MLIQWSLDLADRGNAQVYLEAIPAGKGLYRRFGWEEINVTVFLFGRIRGIASTSRIHDDETVVKEANTLSLNRQYLQLH